MRKFFNLPIDWFVLTIPLIITVTGILTIYTITYQEFGYKLAIDQGIFAVIGLAGMLYFMFTDYRMLNSYSYIIYVVGILLLVPLLPTFAPTLSFVPQIFGAHRWLDFGFFQLQPSEIFKAIAAIISAKLLSGSIGNLQIKDIIKYVIFVGVPLVMVLAQPDLGTTAVLFVVFFVVFLASKPSWRTLLIIFTGLVIVGSLLYTNLLGYQKDRINTFLNPASDPLGEGYNVQQSLIAVGSGGLAGRGFGQGSQTVLNFLPVPHADFIYAGYAEATGFIGSSVLLVLYIVLVFRALSIARDSTDPFGQLLAIGIATKLFFQVTVHLGMNMGLLPVTGIPLPFMSYGGTALIIDMSLIGILESIAIRHKKIVFS